MGVFKSRRSFEGELVIYVVRGGIEVKRSCRCLRCLAAMLGEDGRGDRQVGVHGGGSKSRWCHGSSCWRGWGFASPLSGGGRRIVSRCVLSRHSKERGYAQYQFEAYLVDGSSSSGLLRLFQLSGWHLSILSGGWEASFHDG